MPDTIDTYQTQVFRKIYSRTFDLWRLFFGLIFRSIDTPIPKSRSQQYLRNIEQISLGSDEHRERNYISFCTTSWLQKLTRTSFIATLYGTPEPQTDVVTYHGLSPLTLKQNKIISHLTFIWHGIYRKRYQQYTEL